MQWTKQQLEDWCRAWCRTPHTTLKAFIDAGFCSDQEPSREELRLSPREADADVREALRWALAELRGQTRYDNDEQRANCYERADAALGGERG